MNTPLIPAHKIQTGHKVNPWSDSLTYVVTGVEVHEVGIVFALRCLENDERGNSPMYKASDIVPLMGDIDIVDSCTLSSYSSYTYDECTTVRAYDVDGCEYSRWIFDDDDQLATLEWSTVGIPVDHNPTAARLMALCEAHPAK